MIKQQKCSVIWLVSNHVCNNSREINSSATRYNGGKIVLSRIPVIIGAIALRENEGENKT